MTDGETPWNASVLTQVVRLMGGIVNGDDIVDEGIVEGSERNSVRRFRAGRQRFAVKVASSRDRFRFEVHALTRWFGSRASDPSPSEVPAPRVIGADLATGVIITRWIDGRRGEDTVNDHQRAGAWLRALHDQELDGDAPDPLSVDDAYRARVMAARRVVDPMLKTDGIAALDQICDRGTERLAGLERRRCHRDFAPRNWIVAKGDRLAVVDFEHARLDVPEFDIARLWRDAWIDDPPLEHAFERGYGRPLYGGDPALRAFAQALEQLRTAAWFATRGQSAAHSAALEALESFLHT